MNRQKLELVPLGEPPLVLGFCPKAPVLVGAVPEVRRQTARELGQMGGMQQLEG